MMIDLLITVVIVAITLVAVIGIKAQNNRLVIRLLTWFPPILFAYVVPALLVLPFEINFSQLVIHDFSKGIVIPLAIISVMSTMTFRSLKMVWFKPLFLFVSGSFIIAILPPLLVLALKFLAKDTFLNFMEGALWKGLVPVVGGWIGGSTSQIVLKEQINTNEVLFLSVLVLDNIIVNLWTIGMFQLIAKSDRLNVFFKINNPPIVAFTIAHQKDTYSKPKTLTILLGLVFSSFLLIKSFIILVLISSALGLLLGNFFSKWNQGFAMKLGEFCIVLVMAILGLKLDFTQVNLPMSFTAIMLIWLALHFVWIVLNTLILKIPFQWLAITSMANLGGISTAPAVTASYDKKLMPHAMVLSILSMATGTIWGLLTIYLFQLML